MNDDVDTNLKMATIVIKMCAESQIKCKKCRNVIVERCGGLVMNSHGKCFFETSEGCGVKDTVWYLDEDRAPSWIMDRVEEGEWQKGRLNCPKCGARIGSFDFTTGSRCGCSECVLPGLQLIKTKVDV